MNRHDPNYDKSPHINDKLAGVDFNKIAALADKNHLMFDRVLRNAEKGARTDDELLKGLGRILPTHDWILIDTACQILGLRLSSFSGSIASKDDYSGIAWKSRSRAVTITGNGQGRRGCGVLLSRIDCEALRDLKRVCRISYQAAAKVFRQLQLGTIK